MPLLVEAAGSSTAAADGRERLDIGLVNIMPDPALEATERQFAGRLAAAADGIDVRLRLFTLPGVARGEAAVAQMAGRYGDLAALEEARLDALIVTGAEPLAGRLEDEAYWPALTRVIDWAEHNTASTLWSCLAAHAAVLHLDGIARHPLPSKLSGLFECVGAAPDTLIAGAPPGMRVPHSRWNDLDEGALRRHGYRIVSRSLEAGIDVFSKRWTSRFVFFQGHPEYEPDSLHREFRRDLRRYLVGERDTLPAMPRHYYDSATENSLSSFLDLALRLRAPETWTLCPTPWAVRPARAETGRAPATQLFRNWLIQVAEERR